METGDGAVMDTTQEITITQVSRPQDLPPGPRMVIYSSDSKKDAEAKVDAWQEKFGALVCWVQQPWGSKWYAPAEADRAQEGALG